MTADVAHNPRDAEMAELINEAGMLETAETLAELLVSPDLAGEKGKQIAKQSRFRGQLTSDGALEHAEHLVRDTDMHIEIFTYGLCCYEPRHASCQGDEHGPNHALRTQSVCFTCKNFAVTAKHLPVWRERLRENETVLQQTVMPPGTTKVVRTRIDECRQVIASLEHHPPLGEGHQPIPGTDAPNRYEHRKANTGQQLREALERLRAGTPRSPTVGQRQWKLDVKTLADEAGVSRSTIYQNHREVLDELRNIGTTQRTNTAAQSAKKKIQELNLALHEVQTNQRTLITENAALLARALKAERKLKELRTHQAYLSHPKQPCD